MKNVTEKMLSLDFSELRITIPEIGNWQLAASGRKICDEIEEVTIELSNAGLELLPGFKVQFSFPQCDVVSRWNANAFMDKGVVPEWGPGFSGELASGAPVLGLIGNNGINRLVCSCSDALRKTVFASGVREYTFEINTTIDFLTLQEPPNNHYSVTLRFDRREIPFETALTEAFAHFATMPEYKPSLTPAAGWQPWYSTWYSYHKELFQGEIEAECHLAKQLGMVGVILDDGWQTDDNDGDYRYCGDWRVAKRRFPDMTEHVRKIHEIGLKFMLWYSVPFVGDCSGNSERFKGKYLCHNGSLKASILDPRFQEVRDFLCSTFVNAVTGWNLDGLKLDFIDRFVIPDGMDDPAAAENYAGRDFKSIPEATDVLLTDIMKSLRAINPDILIEFRQQYIGPAIRKYGNLFRAADCPGDITANRSRSVDLRLSSGETAVHGDMLRWNEKESVEAAARQILAVLFAVPQISVKLAGMPEAHIKMIKHRLAFYERHWQVLAQGKLQAKHPEMNYPVVRAEDAVKGITACYIENVVVELPQLADGKLEVIVNATATAEVMVSIPVAAKVTIVDACGENAKTIKLVAGIHAIPVPASGECEIVIAK